MYGDGDYDLAGFAVGAVERGAACCGSSGRRPGDVLIGLASSGLHSNGYSLIRRIVERAAWVGTRPRRSSLRASLAEALLAPTRIYVKSVLPLTKAGLIEGAAHITGGGLIDNPPRAIAAGLEPRFDWNAWKLPAVFGWMQGAAGIADQELRRTFNCGIGMVLITKPESADRVLTALRAAGETAFICGALAKA